MNTVWSSNWSYTHLNAPVMLHFDLSPKGTFNEGLNLGVGVEGRMRLASSAAYSGRDLDGGLVYAYRPKWVQHPNFELCCTSASRL